ncbi:MAG TPA: nucleotide exchange factor GrpE [Candidatus Saccharimonadales bacterium]|nr:nucleotide exchange factor GrpE [Candidatus Saccharimonadales bacterium]
MSKQDSHQPKLNLKRLQAQIEELTLALQRERADSQNIRRRHEEQVAELKNFVTATTVRALLPVIDNFERSLKHVPKDLENNDYISGIKNIVKQFEKVLEDLGVEKIKTVGEPFDPRFHEAVSMDEGDGNEEIVSDEVQPGYSLGDSVIRHAMVKVKLS